MPMNGERPGGLEGRHPEGHIKDKLGKGLTKLRVRNLDGSEIAPRRQRHICTNDRRRCGRAIVGGRHEAIASKSARGTGELEEQDQNQPASRGSRRYAQ